MTLREALRLAAGRLEAAGVESPLREARAVAAHLLGLPPGRLLDPETPIAVQAYENLVARRAAREPMAFITGAREFWTLDLAVSPATLIPRPDSEALVEAALGLFPDRATRLRILDLGTGTGCLLLAVLAEFPSAFGVGLDVSPEAAALAARNATANGLAGRAAFLAGDWAEALCPKRFDLVLCNPPYIPSADIPGLMPEVALFEPKRALDGGKDGVSAYARLMPMVWHCLAPSGAAIFEIGEGQGDAVQALAEGAGLHYVGIAADLAGIPRAMKLCRSEDVMGAEKKLFGSTVMGS